MSSRSCLQIGCSGDRTLMARIGGLGIEASLSQHGELLASWHFRGNSFPSLAWHWAKQAPVFPACNHPDGAMVRLLLRCHGNGISSRGCFSGHSSQPACPRAPTWVSTWVPTQIPVQVPTWVSLQVPLCASGLCWAARGCGTILKNRQSYKQVPIVLHFP